MKLITRNTDYALRAICFIACQKGRVVAVSELTEELKVPRAFLRKLLQTLNKRGILSSSRGSAGGFLLRRPQDKIFLTDLISVFQGPLCLNECFLKKKRCPEIKICPLRGRICKIERYVLGKLGTISIGSLLRRR